MEGIAKLKTNIHYDLGLEKSRHNTRITAEMSFCIRYNLKVKMKGELIKLYYPLYEIDGR